MNYSVGDQRGCRSSNPCRIRITFLENDISFEHFSKVFGIKDSNEESKVKFPNFMKLENLVYTFIKFHIQVTNR